MLTFSDAEAMMQRARNGTRRLGNNTYLHESGPDAYAVQLHATDVVTIRRDGTYTLRTGGWKTWTTKDRLNAWSPARVASEGGTWVIWRKDDPVTAPRIQRCRACKGTGTRHTAAYTETHGRLPRPVYEVRDEWAWNTVHEGLTYAGLYYSEHREMQPLMRDGQPLTDQPRDIRVAGQVTRHETGSYGRLPVPIHHPSEPYQCSSCSGTGQRDYGSRPMPVIFEDGITVDSGGRVTDPQAYARLREPAKVTTAREAAAREAGLKLARSRNRRERAAFIREHGLAAGNGEVIMFKAVRGDLKSYHGAAYVPGTTVTAGDYAPSRACGHGLHFSPDPDGALLYDSRATRFLACAVDRKTMIVLDDKVKARSCRVLYEVDAAGVRLPDDE